MNARSVGTESCTTGTAPRPGRSGCADPGSSYTGSRELSNRQKPDPTTPALSEIVRGFKTFSARAINQQRHSPVIPVWQRSFYEHVIRGDQEYRKIGEYITYNAPKWEMDVMNPRYR